MFEDLEFYNMFDSNDYTNEPIYDGGGPDQPAEPPRRMLVSDIEIDQDGNEFSVIRVMERLENSSRWYDTGERLDLWGNPFEHLPVFQVGSHDQLVFDMVDLIESKGYDAKAHTTIFVVDGEEVAAWKIVISDGEGGYYALFQYDTDEKSKKVTEVEGEENENEKKGSIGTVGRQP